MATYIQWSEDMFLRFKRAYNVAVKSGWDKFTFEGHDYLTSYAKYLVEYMEGKFKKKK